MIHSLRFIERDGKKVLQYSKEVMVHSMEKGKFEAVWLELRWEDVFLEAE